MGRRAVAQAERAVDGGPVWQEALYCRLVLLPYRHASVWSRSGRCRQALTATGGVATFYSLRMRVADATCFRPALCVRVEQGGQDRGLL